MGEVISKAENHKMTRWAHKSCAWANMANGRADEIKKLVSKFRQNGRGARTVHTKKWNRGNKRRRESRGAFRIIQNQEGMLLLLQEEPKPKTRAKSRATADRKNSNHKQEKQM
eukprot:758538-Hanusia_phi.AAC.6